MRKLRTAASAAIMIVSAAVGFFIGAALNDGLGGATLFSLIAGIACIVYTVDNHEKD